MSAPSTSSLSVELLSRVIDVKYGCFTFYFYLFKLKLINNCKGKHNENPSTVTSVFISDKDSAEFTSTLTSIFSEINEGIFDFLL